MPLEQIGQPVIFYAFYTDSGSGKTGLTVTADVWEVIADGTATEIASAQACTEIGDGLYRYRVVGASIDAQAEYIAVFKTAGTCDQAHIPALWVIGKGWLENLATSVEIAALNDVSIAEMQAMIIEGALTLQQVLRIMLAFAAGTTTGGNTTNPVFKSQDGLTDRIDMTVDSDGDRSAVTVDGS